MLAVEQRADDGEEHAHRACCMPRRALRRLREAAQAEDEEDGGARYDGLMIRIAAGVIVHVAALRTDAALALRPGAVNMLACGR